MSVCPRYLCPRYLCRPRHRMLWETCLTCFVDIDIDPTLHEASHSQKKHHWIQELPLTRVYWQAPPSEQFCQYYRECHALEFLNVHSDIVESTEKKIRWVCNVRALGCLTTFFSAVTCDSITPGYFTNKAGHYIFPTWRRKTWFYMAYNPFCNPVSR